MMNICLFSFLENVYKQWQNIWLLYIIQDVPYMHNKNSQSSLFNLLVYTLKWNPHLFIIDTIHSFNLYNIVMCDFSSNLTKQAFLFQLLNNVCLCRLTWRINWRETATEGMAEKNFCCIFYSLKQINHFQIYTPRNVFNNLHLVIIWLNLH